MPTELETLLNLCVEHAEPQTFRGRPTKRRMIGYGDTRYYWKDMPHLPRDPRLLFRAYLDDEIEKWVCLVNVYSGGDKIGEHKDTDKGMDVDAGVVSISYGFLAGGILCPADMRLGTMVVDGVSYPIEVGKDMGKRVPCLYTHTHSATTHKSRCDKRINFTFRKRLN